MSPSHARVDVMAEPSHKAVCLTSLSTRWHCAAEFEASCRTVRLSCSVCQETNNIDRIEWHPWLASWTVEIIARKQNIIHPGESSSITGAIQSARQNGGTNGRHGYGTEPRAWWRMPHLPSGAVPGFRKGGGPR